jgi:peptidoglycan/LPS O-acetylase OafA/YrhL
MSGFSKVFFKNDNKPDHFKALDGLRGISILFVLLSHSSKAGMYFSEYLDFDFTGKVGIYLFFILSAYLLDRQIGLAMISGTADKQFWIEYFRRRLCRVYPMFLFALIIYYILNYSGFETAIDKLSDIPLHLLLIKQESIFWSVPVELKYYFISPLILWVCHKYLKWNFNLVVVFTSVIIIIPMVCHYFIEMSGPSTFAFLPVFVTGTFFAIAEILKKDMLETKIKPRLMDLAGILCFVLIILSIPSVFYGFTGMEFNFLRPLLYVPYAVLWCLILLSAKYGSGLIKRFLELKLLRFFGKISYSMYLLHLPILLYLNENYDVPDWSKIYLFFGGTIICSTITFLCIERPGLKIGQRITSQLRSH